MTRATYASPICTHCCVSEECCVNYNTTAKKQTSDCALFDLWEFKELFPHKFSLDLIHKYISGHGHVICFPCFVLSLNETYSYYDHSIETHRQDLISGYQLTAVVKMFYLWEELKAPNNEVVVAPFTFEQRCLCRRSYSKALSFFLSDCLSKEKPTSFYKNWICIKAHTIPKYKCSAHRYMRSLIGHSRKVQCQVLGNIEKYIYMCFEQVTDAFLFLLTPSILVSNP